MVMKKVRSRQAYRCIKAQKAISEGRVAHTEGTLINSIEQRTRAKARESAKCATLMSREFSSLKRRGAVYQAAVDYSSLLVPLLL